MSPNRIIVARFSPTGRTRRLMSMIAQGLAGTALPVEELDLTDRWEREEARTFGKGDLVFLGVPVYFGRVPLPMQSLAKWKRMALYRIKKVFPAFGIVLSELLLDLLNQFAVKLAAHRFREQCVN